MKLIYDHEDSLNDYQNQAAKTAIYPEAGTGSLNAILYTSLAVAGEGGEIANKAKKILRDDGGVLTDARRQQLYEEAQGCLWELSMFIRELGYTLQQAATANIKLLKSRAERGVIKGDGDKR